MSVDDDSDDYYSCCMFEAGKGLAGLAVGS